MATSGEHDLRIQEGPRDAEYLQDMLDAEKSLSTKLMRIIIKERSTVQRLYGLLTEQKTKATAPDMLKVCPDCRAHLEKTEYGRAI